jgi:PadR family transcriptional regulator PadR
MSLRMTLPVQHVLRVFMDAPEQEFYGLELIDKTDLASGTVYPILARLEREGWVESRWEEAVISEREPRPRRRYYRITADGVRSGREAVERTYRARKRPVPAWISARGATS